MSPNNNPVFNFPNALESHTRSRHTQRAYLRWVDRYLVDVAGIEIDDSQNRIERLSSLDLSALEDCLQPDFFKAWLDQMAHIGKSRQSLDQARSAIVTLVDLLAIDRHLSTDLSEVFHSINVPSVAPTYEQRRLLTVDELAKLMRSARAMAKSPTQKLRNQVVATTLCTTALRREELSDVQWQDVSFNKQRDRALMYVPGSDNRSSTLELPRSLILLLQQWQEMIEQSMGEVPAESKIVRRIWKGGRIADEGLAPDGIWLIVKDAAEHAGLGHVTPDDLRRSVVAGMHEAGVSVEDISRILRHRSVLVTERFLRRITRME